MVRALDDRRGDIARRAVAATRLEVTVNSELKQSQQLGCVVSTCGRVSARPG